MVLNVLILTLGHLQNVELNVRKDFNLAKNGAQIRRAQSASMKRRDAEIASRCDDLERGRISVFEFIEMSANFFEPDREFVQVLTKHF